MPKHCASIQLACRSRVILGLAGFAVGLAAPASAQTPSIVLIRALDYAFQAPDTVAGGVTTVSLQNDGAMRHELVLVRLKPGHTLAEMAAAKTPGERQALQDGFVGVILAEPGQRAMGSLVTELIKGRTYMLFCTLRDSPDQQPHFAQGMVSVLQVR
jgi:hypothetical protein